MKSRVEFSKKGEDVLVFLEDYGILKFEHLEKFFPYSKKVVNHLLKHKRLYKSPGGAYIGINENINPDKCLTAALGVLADIIEKVQSHSASTAPVQVSFITHSGDYYEIIYVGYGMEAMVAAAFETQLAAKQKNKDYSDTAKRIVIVEDKNQMERLRIPGITRFALIQPDGSLSYFKGS